MSGLRKYIAVLLFGIFYFPLAYQPWHVLKHHSQKVNCHQDCCNSEVDEKVCNQGPGIIAASQKEEACPICDYHFPINILPKVFIYQNKNTVVENEIFELKIRLPFQQFASIKTPRAPPAA